MQKFRQLDDRLKALLGCLFFMFVLQFIFAVLRICGIGYFANDYPQQEYNALQSSLILFAFKWLEMFLVAAILTNKRLWACVLISLACVMPQWILPTETIFFIDSFYIVFIFGILNKNYKTVTFGLVLYAAMSAYQWFLLIGRYEIDLTLKWNILAQVASLIELKLFLANISLLSKIIRRIIMQKQIPSADETKQFNGGGCLLFFGKFDKACEIVGKVVVGIVTLGIAPLAVHLWRKKKAK